MSQPYTYAGIRYTQTKKISPLITVHDFHVGKAIQNSTSLHHLYMYWKCQF